MTNVRRWSGPLAAALLLLLTIALVATNQPTASGGLLASEVGEVCFDAGDQRLTYDAAIDITDAHQAFADFLNAPGDGVAIQHINVRDNVDKVVVVLTAPAAKSGCVSVLIIPPIGGGGPD